MMFQKINKSSSKYTNFILVGIQVSILFIFALLKEYDVTSFSDNVMGSALAYGIDITKKINTYYMMLFGLIPVIAIGISRLLYYIFQEDNRASKYMKTVATLGIISSVLAIINESKEIEGLKIAINILLGINTIIVACKIFSEIFKKEFNFENLKWAIVSAMPIAFGTALFLYKFTVLATDSLIWTSIYLIAIIALYILISIKKINKSVLKKAYMFLLVAPLIEAIYLELYNILNQHNIFIVHKYRYELMIYIILGIIGVVYYFINRNKNIRFYYAKYYYPIIIITLAAVAVTLPMSITVNTDFFESANHGMGVYEFFTYGKIPIIETFDAHMMTNQVFGIIYGMLNNDVTGAMFCQYILYKDIIFYIVVYFFLKKVFSRDVAFLITICFPLQNDLGLRNLGIALIAILTLMNAYKKQDIKSYLVYWISLAFLCIWQLDIGYAISISTVAVLIYLLIKDKINGKELKLKNAIITFSSVILTALIFFIVVCLVKDINPIERLIEFLKIAMSNINWAYSSMGENTGIAYAFCYIVMPLIVISTLLYEAFIYKGNNKTKIILLALGLYFVLNVQRGMVRHSIFEGRTMQILNLGVLYISIFVTVHFFNKDVKKFMFFYLSAILVSGTLISAPTNKFTNLLETTIEEYIDFEEQDDVYVEKIERIKLSEQMKNEFANLKIVMDGILENEETYLDLSNQTLLYALLDREKPVYINQSPGLLSGEQSQQFFIEQIEKYEGGVPVVLKAKDKLLSEILDGIENDYRYYLLSEYVYQKYTPAALVDGYEIWIENSKYDEKILQLKEIQNNTIKIVTPDEYKKLEQEQIELEQIARIWGQYGQDENTNNIKILEENIEVYNNENRIITSISEIDKSNGNYVELKIQSIQDTKMTINLYQNEEKLCSYTIAIKEGEHTYKIRVSTLYEWFTSNITNIGLIANDKIDVIDIQMSQANTIKERD